MDILIGKPAVLAPGVMDAIARYRHRVFVEKLGWDLPGRNGLELDQFDHEETLYVAARNASGEIAGTARLLPTDRPYLLSEVFPQLMGGAELPCDPLVWELSRFAATDFLAGDGDVLSQFSSPVVPELLEAVLAEASRHGIRRLITVSPLGIERLLRRYGFEGRRAAPPQIFAGRPLFPCWIEVERRHSRRASLLAALRKSIAQEAGVAA